MEAGRDALSSRGCAELRLKRESETAEAVVCWRAARVQVQDSD